MKKTRFYMLTALTVACLGFASTAQASLVFQMDFNDADGNQSLTDRGTTGVTGAFNGTATYSTDVASVNGGGYSASFSGTSVDNANFGDIDALDELSAFTMTAWVKSSTANSGGPSTSARIVSKRNASTGFELYYHDADDELEFVANGSVANGGGSFAGQQWTWIAVTYDGTTATFYTGDGTTLSAGDSAALAKGAFAATTGELLIGNYNTGTRPYSGLIDNVRIYDSVEDAASLTSIMQFDDASTLIFQMDFNDADGNQSLTDRGTTGVTGSMTGGATYSTDVASVNGGGYSGSFDGSSGAADFGDIAALDGLSAITITAWIKSSTLNVGGSTGSGRIVSKRADNNSFDLYYHDNDNKLEFVANTTPVANGGGSIAGQAWTWIAVTYDSVAKEATFYTGDGATLSAGDTTTLDNGLLNANSASLLIGNTAAGTRTFSGLIDNVRIYNSVEDAASLTSIMQFDDAANNTPDPRVTLSTAADPVDSAYTVDVTFSSDVSGLEASDFVVTNGTASGVSPATGPASTYTVTITPTDLVPATVSVQLPADSVSDGEGFPNRVSNILSTTAVAPEGPKNPITVRVAAYNVEFSKSATPEQIGELLLPYNLDIIGFNEAPDGDWTDRVGAVLGMEYSYVGQISSANHVDKYKSILSRTPLEAPNEFQLTGAGWNPASAVRARTKIDGNSVAFYSLHISGNTGSTDSHAYKLATEVLPLETVDRVIVVGDFNNNIGDFNINAIEDAGFEATWSDLNIDVTQEKTYDAQDSGTSHGVIDHIFFNTSSGARVTDGEIIEEVSPLSDHKPIWAEIAFPDEINILNPSFEEPKQATDGEINAGAVTGWSKSGGTIGNYNLSTNSYTTTDGTDSNGGVVGSMDSVNALFIESAVNESVSQTLSESIVVGNRYELTVAVGDRDNGDGADFAGYTIQLRDEDSVLATVSTNTSPGDGTFTDVVLTYTAQAEDSGLLGLTIGTTNSGPGRATDFDNVRLNYWLPEPLTFVSWLEGYSVGTATNRTDNPDGDALNNLAEFALGGDPSVATDTGYGLAAEMVEDSGGTNWITYVYVRRVNAEEGLTYTVETTTNLTDGVWSTHGVLPAGSGAFNAEFDSVTNRLPVADQPQQFIRLRIALP